MKIINVAQGSPEWLAIRGKYRTASEASAMMGASPYLSRSDLLRMKATGETQNTDAATQARFDRGHEIEALARPFSEEFIGEELYPVTGICDNDYLLASFDGLTMDGDTCWECKTTNADKLASIKAGKIPDGDYWQVVQQLMVSGAERCVYTLSDGTQSGTFHYVLDASSCMADFGVLLASWRQFDADLDAYTAVEVVPEAVGRAPDALPALRIEVQGKVLATNLDVFREHAMGVLAGINRELSTDADFANAEKTVKWCGDVEEKLDLAKEQALAQTADIDQLFRTVDAVKAETRTVRLELEKLVKARKESIRVEILNGGKQALSEYLAELTAGLSGARLPEIKADFAGAMKGKKTIKSLREAVNDELARAKVEVSRIAAGISACMAIYRTEADGHGALFPDLHSLVLKAPDDFNLLIKSRISEHKAAEERKLDAERARIRAEEEAKAQAKVDAAERDRVAQETAERAKRQAEEAAISAKAITPTKQVEQPPVTVNESPTLQELSGVIASHYGVSVTEATGWICDAATQRNAA